MTRPALFIGSSSEGKELARSVRQQLKDIAEVTLWSEGVFGLNEGSLQSLLSALATFDFAVLVLTPDDLLESRGASSAAARDNVLLEAGMFLGRIGPERTFMLCDSSKSLHIPSDFAGVSFATFNGSRRDGNMVAAVGEATDAIRAQILTKGPLLTIAAPLTGAVSLRQLRVSGFVSASISRVVPIVRPVASDDYWVQETAVIDRATGRWSSTVYVGSEGSGSVGHAYEIRAIGDPPTVTGKLKAWPEGFLSQAVVVTRK